MTEPHAGSADTAPRPHVVLDLSRLLSRVFHVAPTGIDRVEMAYARGLLALIPDRLSFGVVHRRGIYGRVPHATALAFLDAMERRWADGRGAGRWARRRFGIIWMARLWARPVPPHCGPQIYLQASPHHLDRPAWVARAIRREAASWVVLAHDAIPLTHPEYAAPGEPARHARRLLTMRRQARAIIANSVATAQALTDHFADQAPVPPIHAIPLGTHAVHAGLASAIDGERPFFLCLGTLEPRKNHLLLLNIWRAMAEARGAHALPRLVIAGRRGWESENAIDMLERCATLYDCVTYAGQVSDAALAPLIAGARALLMPSFAEGYGMPLAEALAAGIPAICSDLPALREVGGAVPDYLDPLDGPAWRDAILDYARPDSSRRAAQCHRLRRWTPVPWGDHLAKVLTVMDSLR